VWYFDSGFPQIILIFLLFLLSAGESACQAAKRWRFLPFARRRLGPFWQPILANRRPIVRNSRRKREKCLFARTHIHKRQWLCFSHSGSPLDSSATHFDLWRTAGFYMTNSHTTSPSPNSEMGSLDQNLHQRIETSEFPIFSMKNPKCPVDFEKKFIS
jgi:hypothetical protein